MSSLALSNLRQNILGIKVGELGIPLLVMVIMAMLVIPLPAFLLDVLFTFNLITGVLGIGHHQLAERLGPPLDQAQPLCVIDPVGGAALGRRQGLTGTSLTEAGQQA